MFRTNIEDGKSVDYIEDIFDYIVLGPYEIGLNV